MTTATLRRFTITILLIASQFACASSSAEPKEQAHELAPKRILFVGNSYFYYNDSLHNHVKRMAEENGPFSKGEYQYKSATIGGARLSHHNLDSLLELGRLGIDEPFDLVILQGGSSEPLTAESRRVFTEKAIELNEKIRATGADVAMYMTHAYVKPHKKYDPKMIELIEPAYVDAAKAIEAFVIPVGLAFERAYAQRPDLDLHKTFDGSHPSLLGTYLAACVVYATVYERPAVNITYDYFGAVTKEDAMFLRKVADETVNAFRGK
ncbi:MAG: DUF4886 domain-containing protein [Pseudomonadota bacterium]